MVLKWVNEYNKRAKGLVKWGAKLKVADTDKFYDELIAFDDVAMYYVLDILNELGVDILVKLNKK